MYTVVFTFFKAAFILGTTAIHTTFYKNMTEDKSCKKIKFSAEEYQKLVIHILKSFKLNADNKI